MLAGWTPPGGTVPPSRLEQRAVLNGRWNFLLPRNDSNKRGVPLPTAKRLGPARQPSRQGGSRHTHTGHGVANHRMNGTKASARLGQGIGDTARASPNPKNSHVNKSPPPNKTPWDFRKTQEKRPKNAPQNVPKTSKRPKNSKLIFLKILNFYCC